MDEDPDAATGVDLGWAWLYPPGQGPRPPFHDPRLLDRLGILLARRRPAVTVVVSSAGAAGELAGAVADLLSRLPVDHPRAGTPVLLIDADREPEFGARGLDGLTGPAVVLVSLTSEAIDRLQRALHIRTQAIAREIPLLLVVAGPDRDVLASALATDAGVPVGVVKDTGAPAPVRAARLRAHAADLAQYHGVAFHDDAIDLAIRTPDPDLAADLLDLAAAVAVLNGRDTVTRDDVFTDGYPGRALLSPDGPGDAACDPSQLARDLTSAVQGQDAALARIAEQVCIGSRGLRLDQDRPQAVLVLAGPSGTGKTTTATCLAEMLRRPLVRVDLAGLTESHTISTLLGSPPGYVGSQEDAGWLTTRLRDQPDAVLLLDEMEKAHRSVLTTLALGIGNGFLTDRSGKVASLRATIVVLTTNLGSEQFRDSPAGFTRSETADTLESVRRTVLADLLPEAANRIDEVVVYAPLVGDALRTVVDRALARYAAVAAGRGLQLTFTAPARRLVAELGTSPEYGARHLHRTIESLLAGQLVSLPTGCYRVRADRRRGALRVVSAGAARVPAPGSSTAPAAAVDRDPSPSLLR